MHSTRELVRLAEAEGWQVAAKERHRPVVRFLTVSPKRPPTPQPRRFCDPQTAFGKPEPKDDIRVWLPPRDSRDPKEWSEFREAVVQHAICISTRRDKTRKDITQEALARLDARSSAFGRWNDVLNGRVAMNLEDLAHLMLHVPDALPSQQDIVTLLQVAEGTIPPPPRHIWDEVDRCGDPAECP